MVKIVHDKEGNLVRIVGLLQSAITCITRTGNAEGACWRVADALGELAEEFPDAAGISEYTGLGFRLDDKEKNTQLRLLKMVVPKLKKELRRRSK